MCRRHHRMFDDGDLDITPWLTRAEELYVVGVLGLARALVRLTGLRSLEDARKRMAERIATVENDTKDLVPF